MFVGLQKHISFLASHYTYATVHVLSVSRYERVKIKVGSLLIVYALRMTHIFF